jgi:hypothetical protein
MYGEESGNKQRLGACLYNSSLNINKHLNLNDSLYNPYPMLMSVYYTSLFLDINSLTRLILGQFQFLKFRI